MTLAKRNSTRNTTRLVWKILRSTLLLFLILYFTAGAFQRKLTFIPPDPGPMTPRDYGVEFQEIDLETPDGFSLHAWWLEHPTDISPQDSRPIDRKTLLYLHGNAASLSALAEVSTLFYQLGLNVFMFNYRGYGKSAGRFYHLSEDGFSIDALSAFDWLADNGVTREDVIVWGHSLGASVAARLARDRSPSCAVLEGAFPSLLSMARYHYPSLPAPEFLFWDRFATAEYISHFKGKTLVVHAERDTIVPLEFGREVFKSAAEPKQFLEIPKIGHNDLPEVWSEYRKQLASFFERC